MRVWQRLAILICFLALMLLVKFSGVGSYLSIAALKEHRENLERFVQERYLFIVCAYILLYITTVALSLPAGAVLTLAGGFLFGTVLGALYANVGATVGAIIAFFLVRYLVGKPLQQKYRSQLLTFNHYVEQYGSIFLLCIHFVAIIPFFLINALAGLTNVSLWTFVWTTSLGVLPGALVYTFAGQQLQEINQISDVFSFPVIIAFVLLALLAFVPALVQLMWKKDE